QEALQRQLQRLFAQNLRLERFADQRRSRPEHGDLDTGKIRIVEQPLLSRRALAAQSAALPDGERHAKLSLDEPCQREIEVVAAQQEMLADRGAGEVYQVAIARNANQAEVAGAAADITDQHDLAIEEFLARRRKVVRDPGV